MSYNLTVTVKGSEAAVTMSGDVPEGEFVISGHEDSHQRNLTLTQRAANGQYVAAAHATHYKEQ